MVFSYWFEIVKSEKRMHIRSHGNCLFRIDFVKSGCKPRNNYTESSFESPISISKLNNYSDFGRKSENYFNVKIFSDSRSKSTQNLILKVFSDSRTQIICRLSEFLKNKIRRYTWLRVG